MSARAGRAHQRRALDQLVAGEREQTTLGRGGQRVAGAPDPLQPGGDRPRRPDQAAELDGAHVDAELQRRGGHDDLEVARLQEALGPVAPLAREAAVVGRDALVAQALAEMQRHPLDQAARVDEHQRRLVLAGQGRDPIVELRPLFVRGHGAQLVLGHLDAQIEVAALADVDHRRRSGRVPPTSSRDATSSGRTVADRPMRWSLPGLTSCSSRSSERRQVRAALVGRHGVNFVDDHRPHVAQRPPARLGGQENEERLGRGHQDVRRSAGRLAPFARRRVARSGPPFEPPAPRSRARRPAP